MKKEEMIEETKEGSEIPKSEKEQIERGPNLPEQVEDYGHSVFLFATPDYDNFLETLAKFKELNKNLKISTISPLWDANQDGVWHFGKGYCVNCEEKEKEE